MLTAGKSEAEVVQKLEITESTWQRWNSQYDSEDYVKEKKYQKA